MVDEGEALRRALPVTSRVLECFEAAVKDGWGARDITMLPARFNRP
jgi:hypothetical protein